MYLCSYQTQTEYRRLNRNYVDKSTAQSKNLSFASGNKFVMKADSTTKLSASGPGRNSIRIHSNKQWTTHTLVYVLHAIFSYHDCIVSSSFPIPTPRPAVPKGFLSGQQLSRSLRIHLEIGILSCSRLVGKLDFAVLFPPRTPLYILLAPNCANY